MKGTRKTCARHSTNTILLKQTDHRLYPNSKLDMFHRTWNSSDEPQFANKRLDRCVRSTSASQYGHRAGYGLERNVASRVRGCSPFPSIVRVNTTGKYKKKMFMIFGFVSSFLFCCLLIDTGVVCLFVSLLVCLFICLGNIPMLVSRP